MLILSLHFRLAHKEAGSICSRFSHGLLDGKHTRLNSGDSINNLRELVRERVEVGQKAGQVVSLYTIQ